MRARSKLWRIRSSLVPLLPFAVRPSGATDFGLFLWVEYGQTGHTGHAAQALMILEILDGTLNESELRRMAKVEGVLDVLSALRTFLRDPARSMVTDTLLREIRDGIHLRRRGAGPFPAEG